MIVQQAITKSNTSYMLTFFLRQIMSWKDQYESAAERESAAYEAMSVKTLLSHVQQGQYGQYHMIWSAVAEQATLKEAAWTLFDVLQHDKSDYLLRYNCAKALLELMGREDVMEIPDEVVNLSRGTPAMRLPYLTALQQELISRIGQPPVV